jgi:hypothetical protein
MKNKQKSHFLEASMGHPTATRGYKIIYVGYIIVGSVDEFYPLFVLSTKRVDIHDLALYKA